MRKKSRTITIDGDKVKKFWLYHDRTCQVWVQGAYWWGEKERIQIVPGNGVCAVALTDYPGVVGFTKPAKGYLVYDPASLVLDFVGGAIVTIESVNTGIMRQWVRDTLPWLAIGRKRDNTRNTW